MEAECCAPGGARTSSHTLAPAGEPPAASARSVRRHHWRQCQGSLLPAHSRFFSDGPRRMASPFNGGRSCPGGSRRLLWATERTERRPWLPAPFTGSSCASYSRSRPMAGGDPRSLRGRFFPFWGSFGAFLGFFFYLSGRFSFPGKPCHGDYRPRVIAPKKAFG